MTNGEKLKEVFGVKDEQIRDGIMFVTVDGFDCPKDNFCGAHDFFKNWWNAEYKEPSNSTSSDTKNETLVSLDVYKQVAKERDIAIEQLHELGYEFGQKIAPRKGHWINKHRLFDSCSCSAECSSCHKRSKGYMRGSRFGLVSTYYDFCPKCGSDNREVEK